MIRRENAEGQMTLSNTTLIFVNRHGENGPCAAVCLAQSEILNLWLCSALYRAIILLLGEEMGGVLKDYESFFTLYDEYSNQNRTPEIKIIARNCARSIKYTPPNSNFK